MLDLKLERANLSLTISEYNRDYFLEKFPRVPPHRIKIHRVGVDLRHFEAEKKEGTTSRRHTDDVDGSYGHGVARDFHQCFRHSGADST